MTKWLALALAAAVGWIVFDVFVMHDVYQAMAWGGVAIAFTAMIFEVQK